MKFFRRRRRSLVRILASCVPNCVWNYFLPVPPRMYITANVMNRISSLRKNNIDAEDESFYSFKSHFYKRKENQMLNSTPLKDNSKNENNRLVELQRELEEIKMQVAKLMEHQCEQLHCSGYGTLSNPSAQLQKSFAPPRPPPPPPPLPTFQLGPVTNPLKIETKVKQIVPQIRNGLPTGKELLRDLKKVQLRKVEKSPGGGPLKKTRKINDPGDFLEEVLKKRFGLVQISPESSLGSLSCEANDSFNSGSYNSNHQINRNLVNSVT